MSPMTFLLYISTFPCLLRTPTYWTRLPWFSQGPVFKYSQPDRVPGITASIYECCGDPVCPTTQKATEKRTMSDKEIRVQLKDDVAQHVETEHH